MLSQICSFDLTELFSQLTEFAAALLKKILKVGFLFTEIPASNPQLVDFSA